jgi:alanine racemase
VTGLPLHEVRIDLSALRENAAVLARRGTTLADVRADAYGHGAVEASRAAVDGGATTLLVSDSTEADVLRSAGLVAEFAVERAAPPGAALYGLDGDPELRTAMTVLARVVATKTIDAGEGVSYGHSYIATARTNLALLGIGYAEGLDRSAGNRATIRLGGADRLIAGRVAMNALVLELGDDMAAVGDVGIVFGDPCVGQPPVSGWAAALELPVLQCVTAFGTRLPRSFR